MFTLFSKLKNNSFFRALPAAALYVGVPTACAYRMLKDQQKQEAYEREERQAGFAKVKTGERSCWVRKGFGEFSWPEPATEPTFSWRRTTQDASGNTQTETKPYRP